MVERIVHITPMRLEEVETRFSDAGIRVNQFGAKFLSHHSFDRTMTASLRILSLMELGLEMGGCLSDIYYAAQIKGLKLCPPETGVFLRLAMTDQEVSCDSILSGKRAPQSAITVASEKLSDDPAFPKGLYLRNVDGVLWLRGFICDDAYIWNPTDIFAFINEG